MAVETKMLIGCAFFLGLAAFFFCVYARRKNRDAVHATAIESRSPGESI